MLKSDSSSIDGLGAVAQPQVRRGIVATLEEIRATSGTTRVQERHARRRTAIALMLKKGRNADRDRPCPAENARIPRGEPRRTAEREYTMRPRKERS